MNNPLSGRQNGCFGLRRIAQRLCQHRSSGRDRWNGDLRLSRKETDEEAFFKRHEACAEAILEIPFCQGCCYTQLTDIMQEINGLLTPDRKPKMDAERVREIRKSPF